MRQGVCVHTRSVCDPVDCNALGFSVQGILQARILECVAISSSRRSPRPRDQTRDSCVSCIAGRFFTIEPSGRSGEDHKTAWAHVCMRQQPWQRKSPLWVLSCFITWNCIAKAVYGIAYLAAFQPALNRLGQHPTRGPLSHLQNACTRT